MPTKKRKSTFDSRPRKTDDCKHAWEEKETKPDSSNYYLLTKYVCKKCTETWIRRTFL